MNDPVCRPPLWMGAANPPPARDALRHSEKTAQVLTRLDAETCGTARPLLRRSLRPRRPVLRSVRCVPSASEWRCSGD